MFGSSDPNLIIAGLAIGGFLLIGLWRLIAWVRDAPVTPDPWDSTVEQKLQEPETREVCPHCLTEQPPTAWFCRRCGRAVGPYNNVMPYLQIFSEGEVFRNGTSERMRKSPLIPIGYFLISLGFLPLIFSQPLGSWLFSAVILVGLFSYWSSLLENLKRSKVEPSDSQPEGNEEQKIQH
jgi:hypothetical protein